MPHTTLKQRIRQGPFLLDGAMGTQLMARGIDAGTCNDYLTIDSPDTVLEIHKAYLNAGSDAVLTNTFGANGYALARHGHAAEVTQINSAAADIARKAAGPQKYVLGDIGPTGDFLEPLGSLKPDQLRHAFAEQANALLAGGVDGFIIETMTALDELSIAIEAARSVAPDMPIIASMAFDHTADDFKTMMGVGVKAAVSAMLAYSLDAIGFNCGTASLDQYIELARKIASTIGTSGQDVLICAEPNAGKPELVDGKALYKVPPEDFAATVKTMISAGVTIVGGCCGTGPEHIQAVAKALKK